MADFQIYKSRHCAHIWDRIEYINCPWNNINISSCAEYSIVKCTKRWKLFDPFVCLKVPEQHQYVLRKRLDRKEILFTKTAQYPKIVALSVLRTTEILTDHSSTPFFLHFIQMKSLVWKHIWSWHKWYLYLFSPQY